MAQELEDGGVAVEEEASAAADAGAGTIYWDFRDSAWVARAKTPGGENVTKRTSIHRRMTTPGDSLCGLSRTDAKAAAHEELRSWTRPSWRASSHQRAQPRTWRRSESEEPPLLGTV